MAGGKKRGVFEGGGERVLIQAIGGDARGTAVDDGANGNREAVFGDILMNGVIGKACQRVDHFVDFNFGFRDAA